MTARCADGRRLPCLGRRTVPLRLWGGQLASVDFLVFEVSRPILSVSALQRTGYTVHFGMDSYIRAPDAGSATVSLHRHGGLYYVPVKLEERQPWSQDGLSLLSGTSWPEEVDCGVVTIFVGSPRSELVESMRRCGVGVCVFEAKKHDANCVAARVAADLVEHALTGRGVIVWFTLGGDLEEGVVAGYLPLLRQIWSCCSERVPRLGFVFDTRLPQMSQKIRMRRRAALRFACSVLPFASNCYRTNLEFLKEPLSQVKDDEIDETCARKLVESLKELDLRPLPVDTDWTGRSATEEGP